MLQLTHSLLSTTTLSAAEAMLKLCYRGVNYQLPQSTTNDLAQDLRQGH
jgi:hypothetical protein